MAPNVTVATAELPNGRVDMIFCRQRKGYLVEMKKTGRTARESAETKRFIQDAGDATIQFNQDCTVLANALKPAELVRHLRGI